VIRLDGPGVTIADVVAVARDRRTVEISDAARARMTSARDIVERLAEGEPKYGISTFAKVRTGQGKDAACTPMLECVPFPTPIHVCKEPGT
jgi:histidine ammonia-lyase